MMRACGGSREPNRALLSVYRPTVVIVDPVSDSRSQKTTQNLGLDTRELMSPSPRDLLRWRYAWRILKRHFAENQLLLRASAITYATLLSSVPFLAVMLSILRGLGVEDRVLPFVIERLRIGGEQPVDVIINTVERLNPAALGAAGAVGLLLAALLLLAQVDGTFNAIWGVRENRPLTTRLVGYGGLLVLGPMAIAVWTSVVSWLRLVLSTWPADLSTLSLVLTRTAGPVLVLLILTLLYIITPNTRVRFLPALAGSLVATILLELSQMLFVTFIKTSATYDLVYGAIAVLPIFLTWIYLNWLAILLGAEAAYLVQNVPTWLREAGETGNLSWSERERLSLACAALVVNEREPTSVDELAAALEVSPRLVHHPLDDLEDAGWIVPVQSKDGRTYAYAAADKLNDVTLGKIRRSLRRMGEPSEHGSRRPALYPEPQWMEALEPLERQADQPFDELSPMDLAERLVAGSAAQRPEPPKAETPND